MQDITTPPWSIGLLFFTNLLGNMGLTIIKVTPCPDLDQQVRACDLFWSGTILLGCKGLPLSGLHKIRSHMSDVRKGNLDSRGYTSTPCIRNFSGKGSHPASCPLGRRRFRSGELGL